jgi:HD-GYP domain-containing protein (c-di-GMP phosphodiesterase class II)
MKDFDLTSINHGYFFSEPVYLDEGFVLLSPEMAFSEDIAGLLKKWYFNKVMSNGTPLEYYSGVGGKGGDSRIVQNDAREIDKAREYINDLEKFVANVFALAQGNAPVDFNRIAEKVRILCDELRENRKYILQVQHPEIGSEDEDFYASHCVRSAIVAVIIGMHIKLPAHKLVELGIAALLHEIGMVRLPPEIYRTKTSLSKKERDLLLLHPTLGYELLKSYRFPISIGVTCLEHHERENGSGYPHHLLGKDIGLYSKITAVACSYAAITENKPHKDARAGYEGVTDLLRNDGKQYDENIVRSLVFSLSIYPIGQYVLLSNGKKAQVVDTTEDPRYPVVQVFYEQTPDGKNRIVRTSQQGTFIARPLDKNDI